MYAFTSIRLVHGSVKYIFKLNIKRKSGMVCMENGIKMETCTAMLKLNSV